jgi:hypothetical protein
MKPTKTTTTEGKTELRTLSLAELASVAGGDVAPIDITPAVGSPGPITDRPPAIPTGLPG